MDGRHANHDGGPTLDGTTVVLGYMPPMVASGRMWTQVVVRVRRQGVVVGGVGPWL